MDYEEKYKTALERARKWKDKSGMPKDKQGILNDIFPELAESEDERIRKAILEHIQLCTESIPDRDKFIAYLEKQGEKDKLIKELGEYKVKYTQEILSQRLEKQGNKPKGKSALEAAKEENPDNANKVEPEFHEGDWVILTVGELSTTIQIVKVDTNKKLYWFNDSSYLPIVDEECLHLWNIQDAKQGDVLYSPNLKLLWIFKSRDTVYCGCNLNYNDGAICGEGYFHMPTDAMPATKEQCDLFFQKMKEAGCRWNSTEKKLEKIDSGKESESKKEEKSYNTEECNCIIQDTISICEQARKNATNEIDYENTTRCIGWLKILKYRHTYKPSKEQMDTLLFISSVLKDEQVIVNLEELKTLYNDLKKL